jgi:hypothetical protein
MWFDFFYRGAVLQAGALNHLFMEAAMSLYPALILSEISYFQKGLAGLIRIMETVLQSINMTIFLSAEMYWAMLI